ncbi:hypothetical protein [Pseudomonas abieticivorans]|uniref:hypothetical protein n=1 Tax=Pseudomonas abieticivorans TaxID=2931382 RepID=UPI0020BD9672|nr:hypothetical protein [Pseudomonas sp. PIA16]
MAQRQAVEIEGALFDRALADEAHTRLLEDQSAAVRAALVRDPDDAVKHAIVACLSLPFGTPAYSAAVVARLRESGVKNLVDTLSAVKGAAMS